MTCSTSDERPSRLVVEREVEPVVTGSKKLQLADIITFNSSGRPQLESVLDMYGNNPEWKRLRADGHFGCDVSPTEPVPVAVVLAQEHHAQKRGFQDLQYAAKKCGWQLQGAAAVASASGIGSSAGVCIATNAQFMMGKAAGMNFDLSPRGSEGRLSVAWVDGVLRGGVMVLSVYLWHTEGLTDRNMDLLNAVGEAVARFGGPWVLGGDMNLTPEDLACAPDWLRRIGGVIQSPGEITCKSASGGRTIDFFVVDGRVSSASVACWVDYDFPGSPHYVVRLRLRCDATRDLARLLKKA